LTLEFPTLSPEDSVSDTVVVILDDGRGAARVTFKNNRKYSLPWARNENYGGLSELTRMIDVGNVVTKKKFSEDGT
jgi:hypothetical protein